MIDPFLLRALIAGLIIAAIAAPLGCLVVWRRMAYFGDATGHAGLLGVALGMTLGLPITISVTILAIAVALAVTFAASRGNYAVDTILGVFAHSALAIGLVTMAMLPNANTTLVDTLVGDILLVTWSDILTMAIIGGALFLVVVFTWRNLINATISPELLVAEGGSANRDRLIFTLVLAVFVAISMKLIGVLLITAMLILPAAAARPIARSPEQMWLFASAIGALSVISGLYFSWVTDAPSGPSIVMLASLFFVLLNLVSFSKRS